MENQITTNFPRAERWVRNHFPGLTGRQAVEALELGLVTMNERRMAKGFRAPTDSEFSYERLEQHLEKIRLGNEGLSIRLIEKRDDFLIVDKAAGIPSQPISLFDVDTVSHWVFARFPEVASRFSEAQPTLAVHRLDTGTSGAMIVALSPESYDEWRRHFTNKQVRKSYLAWCWGNPEKDHYEISKSIGSAGGRGDRRRVVEDGEDDSAYPAESRVTVVSRTGAAFLAKVDCETGVTHQVRVHLAALGFPLVGDRLYDPEWKTRTNAATHHLLRAVTLETPEGTFRADEALTTEFSRLLLSSAEPGEAK